LLVVTYSKNRKNIHSIRELNVSSGNG
jgi:hypothetical protein